MVIWSAILLGFVMILFIFLGIFIHYVRVSLNSEDSTRIDPMPKKKE